MPPDTTWPEGSPGLGSGVYIPEQQSKEERKLYINPRSFGEGNENMINRAELVGILFALQEGSHHIATDSMTSMHQIRKQLLRPQELEGHKHHDLIKAIDACIQSSSEPIHLYKVPAHQGVVGNEHAGEIAKAAAKGTSPAAETHHYDRPSNSRTQIYWPVEASRNHNRSHRGVPGNATAAITPSRVYAAVEVAVDLGGTIAGATDVEGAAAAGQAAGAGTVAEAVARGGICPSAGNVNGTAAAADSSRVAKGKAAPVDGLEKSGAMLLEASGAEVVTGTAGFEEAARRASVYRKCSTAAAAAVIERDVQPRGQAGAVSKLKASARAAGADAAVEGAGLPSRAKAAGAATAAAAAAAQAMTEEGEVAAASAAGVAVRSRRASEGIEVELGVVEETWVNKLGKRVGGSGALVVEQELKRSRGGPAAAALKVQGGLLLPAESLGDRVGNRGGSISASIGLHSQAVPQHLHVKGSRGQSRSKQQDIPKLFSGLGTQPPLAAISSTARAAPATTAAAVRLAVGRPPRATSRAARGVKRQHMGMDGGTAAQFHANWDDVLDNFKPPSKCNIIHMGH